MTSVMTSNMTFIMKDYSNILFTGGSGLLGSAFRKILPQLDYPPSSIFDITKYADMDEYIGGRKFHTIIHAAAITSPPRIEENPHKALEVNVMGTANIVKLCIHHSLRLIYISTDYVFRGDQGNYQEHDLVYPINAYAWSKLGGECAVRLHDDYLIIRTSFSPETFPYDKAFTDQWTSREPVSSIAKKIACLLPICLRGVIHVGGKRQTVFEYAKSLDPTKEIGTLTRDQVSFLVPKDTSLDSRYYDSLFL